MILPTRHITPELIQNQIEFRGRSWPKQETKEGMEFDNLTQLKGEPHLAGAYIQSLVEQLTISGTKDSMNSKEQEYVVDGYISQGQYSTKHRKVLDAQHAQQPTQPKRHRKQVRRRLHTSRPHQERLLNMAEARREIAAALKYHRAAMKQAIQKKQQQQQQQPLISLQPPQQPNSERGITMSKRNPRMYPSSAPDFSDYRDNLCCSSFSQPPPTASNPFCWPSASPIAPSLLVENPNFILPSQTMGLNFHDFSNFDATLCCNSNSTSLYSYSSPPASPPVLAITDRDFETLGLNFNDFNNLDVTLCRNSNSNSTSLFSHLYPSSSSPPVSVITDQELPSAAISQGEGSSQLVDIIDSSAATLVTAGLHTAMDDVGMTEIRSLGEQYQMEWNDGMNLVTSTWWFEFSQNMELGATVSEIEDDACPISEEIMEFPAWLNANESCLEQCSEEYFQDLGLPW